MKKSTVAMAIASALAANKEYAMAVTCTANGDATLRACITNAVNGDVISVATDITLSSFLPDITKNVTVQGNNRRISGNNAHRVFWVESGTVAIQNLTIANGLAQGGSGGGGGAGLGGGLFVNGGTISLSNLTFTQNAAKGGSGGSGDGLGGGGMGGNGTSSGGGGRLLGENGSGSGGVSGYPGTNGGFGGGGGGGGWYTGGGYGGFGGGGGNGGKGYVDAVGNGGKGGFGGGGGGGGNNNTYNGIDGAGGFGGFGGGNGASPGAGGGGIGAGAAIFAKAGALTLKNVAFTQNSNSGGTGANAGQGKATLFICTSTEDASCAATVTANSCGIVFTGNTATNAGTTNTDNADTFNLNRSSLAACLPTASANTPTVITATSAKLSGTVHPGGASTTVNFDFGATTSYGQTIIATPATIAATANFTNVSADATNLLCSTSYHYRVKAVNSKGTGYSTDKSFSTNTCLAPNSIHLTNGVAATNQTITANEWKYYYLSVPTGADTLKFITSGSGDIDIYAQINALPTDSFACSSENGGSIETCQPTTTTAGTWWLGVYAYEDSTFSVTGSFRQTQTISAISFNPTTLTAGQTTTASATASSGLPVTFTTATPDVCSTNGSTVQGLHLGTCTINANQAGDGNYVAATTVSKNITVSKGTQTITLTCDPANITVGTTSNCTAIASSGLTPTVTAAPSSVCTLNGNTLTAATVGTCTVTATQAGNADFSAATTVTTSVPVAKSDQTITLTCTPLSIAVGGTATCTATASSNLTPSLSIIDPSICTINGSTVTGLVVGICTVKAKQIGNSNYNAATPVTQNITVGNVVIYKVTPTVATGGNVSPNTVQDITQGSTASFTVTANTGYTTNSAVGGNCPQGIWNNNVWTTGAIIANCSVNFGFTPNTYTVTATAGSGGTVTPPATRTITHGTTTSFTVNANTDYTINTAVGSNCPNGSWNGNIWTTGTITAACSVSFSFTYNPIAINGECGTANGGTFPTKPTTNLCNAGTASAVTNTTTAWNWTCNGVNGGSNTSCTANITRYTVTPSAGSGGIITPNSAQSVAAGTTASFTVTATNGYTLDTAVTGTCPPGTWNVNVWTTGVITTSCSVNFKFTPIPANAWLNPPSPIVKRDRPFTLDVTANSNTMKIASYKFTVTIDPSKLTFDTEYQNIAKTCVFGICPGTYALTSLIVDDTDLNTGTVVLIGQDTQGGKGPGNDLQLVVAHLKTKTVLGTTPVTLITNKLNNPSNGSIGLASRDATVTISPGLCGDADGNDVVNIVDALAIARKLVNLPPPPTVDVTLADTNKNGRLDINDALFIARFAIGLVLPPEACAIGQPL